MNITQDLQCYRVGGSVRDELMGLPSGDRDWVVVGTTPEEMLARGFKPVGKDFPVFLHPQTHEEYALARTERKTGPGYKGFAVHFSPDVTLEDDLLRRDLSINAMAVPAASEAPAQDALIDPFNGLHDLRHRIFRHVSPAFREDPVRILRLARFAARFPDFVVADETLALMRDMSATGEVNALVAERVWQEISRGLMSARPSRMLHVLDDSGALAILLPPLSPVATRPAWLNALDASAAAGDALPVRFAILMLAATDPTPLTGLGTDHSPQKASVPGSTTSHERHPESATHPDSAILTDTSSASSTPPDTHRAQKKVLDTASIDAGKKVEALAQALRAPNECIDAATRLATEMPGPIPQAAQQWFADPDRSSAPGLLALFNRHDVWRRPERLAQLLRAARRLADAENARPQPAAVGERIAQTLTAARAVDTGAIARQHASQAQTIKAAIEQARLHAIEHALNASPA